MRATSLHIFLIAIGSLPALSAGLARADNPAQWAIVEEIRRTDTTKSWISPTTVDLAKMVWLFDFEITKLTGTVNLGILGDVTQDITSSLSPEVRMGSGESSSLPAILVSTDVAPADSGSSAHLLIEIDSLGFGHAEFTDIMLGSINVPLFGARPIQRLNLEANVTVVGYDFGDFNRDGAVDGADYVVWRKEDGSSANYDQWRSHFGVLSGVSLDSQNSIPEPACVVIVTLAACLGMVSRRSTCRAKSIDANTAATATDECSSKSVDLPA